MGGQLFLHVGDCKTGSTVLQTMLARGDCQPENVRLFFPGQAGQGQLARSLIDRSQLYPKRWIGVSKRLAAQDWDVAVLSTELFEFVHPEKVAMAVRDHLPGWAETVRVVVYVRPHASRVLSQFAENIKLGHDTGSLTEFYNRFSAARRLDYAERLGRWHQHFGDRLIVRPFLRDRLAQGDIRHDFLSIVLHGAPYALTDSGQDDNAALSVQDLALLRDLQSRFHQNSDIDTEARVAFGKHFGRLLNDMPPTILSERLRLPRALYDRLRDHCATDAARMDREWFGGPCFVPELERAAASVVEQEQSLDAVDYHSPETLRLMRAWAELLSRQMAEDPKVLWQRFRAPL